MKTLLIPAAVLLTTLSLSLMTGATLLANPPEHSHRGGTTVLHFLARENLQSDADDTNAASWLELRQYAQGRADQQSLELFVKGLETNSPYLLVATTATQSNAQEVAQFQSDNQGRAQLFYRWSATGHGHGTNRWVDPLPEALNPVCDIRTLAITAASNHVVLTGDLHNAAQLEYLLKRPFANGQVYATLWIRTDRKDGDLRLFARGLSPDTDYFLALNGGISQTNHTDGRGRLAAGAELVSPSDILDLRSVALWDTTSNVVVSTQLP